MIPAWLWFATIALLFWGVTGITQKLSTNRISSELSFLWFAYAMIAISAVLVFTVPMHWHVSALVAFLAIIGGTLNAMGALTSFAALEAGGKASVVISLISLYPLLTVILAVALLHESLTKEQIAGIIMAIAAAILLSLEPNAAATTAATTE
jgi:bacterial/archaeal transporter family protein